jgi:hypothetical protein
MKLFDSAGREVTDIEVVDFGCDAYVTRAVYMATGCAVPDDELNYLTDTYPEYVQRQAYENAIVAAEYACEGDR